MTLPTTVPVSLPANLTGVKTLLPAQGSRHAAPWLSLEEVTVQAWMYELDAEL